MRLTALRYLISLTVLVPAGVSAQQVDLTPRRWAPGEEERYDSLTRLWSRRVPLARGKSGMISATSGAAAVRSGFEALKQGGTAMDAALTHALADIVLLAGCCVSHAGFMTMVYYEASSGKVYSMNAGWNSVRAETDPLSIPSDRPTGRSAVVPGFMAGAEEAHRRFGKLPWAALFEPAIYFAEHGVTLDRTIGGMIASRKAVLERLPATKAVYSRPDGSWYAAGDRFTQPALAKTLREVARQGSSYMYRGDWAKHFVAAVAADGGKLTLDDLARYRPIWSEPARTTFRGYEVAAVAPPTLGGVNLLEALNLVELADLPRLGHYTTSPEALDRLIGIARVNDLMGTSIISMLWGPRADLYRRYAPSLDSELGHRLGKSQAQSVWAGMREPGWRDLERAVFDSPADAPSGHSDAVVAVDSYGNVAAVLHTINTSLWGNTGIVVDGVSIADIASHQQRILARIPPGSRVPDPTNPLLVLDHGKPIVASSSIGVGLHEQTLQSLVNVLDYGFDPTTAVDTGQFLRPAFALMDPAHAGSQVVAEGEFSPAMLDSIRARGRGITVVPQSKASGSRGGWVGIVLDRKTGELFGAATRFFNGWAIGY
jgi:gamma-glutamyltranspeptidase/glutathione hydrolase